MELDENYIKAYMRRAKWLVSISGMIFSISSLAALFTTVGGNSFEIICVGYPIWESEFSFVICIDSGNRLLLMRIPLVQALPFILCTGLLNQ